jgi:hypothetical protein
MSSYIFQDQPVIANDINTWPDSPDRTLLSVGRETYGAPEVQSLLNGNPEQPIALSQFNHILSSNGESMLEGYNVAVWSRDPVLDIIKAAGKQNCFIEDDSFPVDIWFNEHNGVKHHARIKNIIDRPVMYENGPCLNDKSQINLGNCGFVAAFGSLCLHPEGHNILFSSIYPPVYNPIGIYSVRLIQDDNVYYILVDDRVPQESFSSMDGNEFWYYIIEKAFAKLNGGYDYLGGGAEYLMGLNSTSNLEINNQNKDKIWNDYFIKFFTHEQRTTYQGTGYNTNHLVSGHAYSVIDASSWQDIRLVRLHNPWNIIAYTGPYAPSSPEWAAIPIAVQKEIFQVERFKNKTFWIPYDLYLEDIPKISSMYLNTTVPESIKSIAKTISIQGGKVPPESDIPDWDSNMVYVQPCQRVRYKEKIWLNGWWSRGDRPDEGGENGVWREEGSKNMHVKCQI